MFDYLVSHYHGLSDRQKSFSRGPNDFKIVLDQTVVKPFVSFARSHLWGVEVEHGDLLALSDQHSPANKEENV